MSNKDWVSFVEGKDQYIHKPGSPQVTFSCTSNRTQEVYNIHPVSWDCECKGFKFSKYPAKKCKHLCTLNRKFSVHHSLPSFPVESTGIKPPFQPVGYVPRRGTGTLLNGWLVSIKYNGIRVCVYPNGHVVTRNGLRLLRLERAIKPTQDWAVRSVVLDCELCLRSLSSSHDKVFSRFVHTCTSEPATGFILRIIDVIPDKQTPLSHGTFEIRYEWLRNQQIPGKLLHLIPRFALPARVTLLQVQNTILTRVLGEGYEGIILVNGSSVYTQRRSNSTTFKMKKIDHLIS